jgi:ubiquinone/menaquinone biosynthesis C-methylase UbiE
VYRVSGLEKNLSFEKMDKVIGDYVIEHPSMHERWLLEQTLHTAGSRRTIASMLELRPGLNILDLGTGFGAMTFDLAAMSSLAITAVDRDETTLTIANDLLTRLEEAQTFTPGSSIRFVNADAEQLPFASHSFDFAFSRFVFQHLPHPEAVLKELKRVLAPNGFVCVIDIDDQLTLAYPEESSEYLKLKTAFGQLQDLRGGDRHVGRKIASYMQNAGLEVTGTLIFPTSGYGYAQADDLSHRMIIEQFTNTRAEILEHGLLSPEEYDRCLARVSQEDPGWQFNSNGQVITIGKVPAE